MRYSNGCHDSCTKRRSSSIGLCYFPWLIEKNFQDILWSEFQKNKANNLSDAEKLWKRKNDLFQMTAYAFYSVKKSLKISFYSES